jgi:hypothetical protein
MDIAQLQNIVGWIIGVFAVGILSLAASFFAVLRSGKMLPKDLKGADIKNDQDEANLAKTYKAIATEAAQETLTINQRVSALEEQVHDQSIIIMQQSETIRLQGEQIAAQDEIIAVLQCKLNNSEMYNKALIDQMEREHVTPVSSVNMRLEDCNKAKNKKKKSSEE